MIRRNDSRGIVVRTAPCRFALSRVGTGEDSDWHGIEETQGFIKMSGQQARRRKQS